MKGKTFFIGFFALVVVAAAASIYVRLTTEHAQTSFTAALAPDGKYKAVKITVTRAGPPAFCTDIVAVILAVYPDEFAERDKAYEVYAAPCAADHALPKIEWRSNTDLQISYARESAATKSPVVKETDVTKTVRVTFGAQ